MGNQAEKAITEKEILEIALKIERDGMAFYKGLCERTTNPEAKTFLNAMTKEETLHEAQLKTLFKARDKKIFEKGNKDALSKFIKANFQTDIFPDINKIFDPSSEFESLQKAIDFAIDAENTSKEFYAMLGEYCDDFEAKTALVLLEKAETEHLKRIMEIKNHLFKE